MPTRRNLLATNRLPDKVWRQVKICLNSLVKGNFGYTIEDCLDEIMELVETKGESID